MDYNNGLYVFNGVPGLDASKGERIVKALQNLQAKIKHLETLRDAAKETYSKGVQTGNYKDMTVIDVQLKLLVLQIQYLRAVLRKKPINLDSLRVSENIAPENALPQDFDVEDDNQNKETQTGTSLLFESNPEAERPCESEAHQEEEKIDGATASGYSISTANEKSIPPISSSKHSHVCNASVPGHSVPARDHYHLKFDDVPFILGASSSASHNIVANVQNILALMKTHNKALCGPKPLVSRNSTPAVPAIVKNSSQDTNKLLRKLSEDLSELQSKQEKLKERFDLAENGSHFVNTKSKTIPSGNSDTFKNGMKKSTGCDPNGDVDSTNFNSKGGQQLSKPKRSFRQEKHAVPTNRMQASTPQVHRNRFMRSLREFKTHLSEEDISWD